ncbi:uncharacterized protein [Apostichopus japonicus]|uniref:Luqin-like n=1 Tax=Stichopus japonicus TaxID=307972 RepID=A0A2Z4C096_STIJA|nr:luqin-like precursor [Apostichopus japonicus]
MAVSKCQLRNIFCCCFVVLLLGTFFLPSTASESMEASRKRKPYKFMRWGKRFYDDTDVLGIDTSESPGYDSPQHMPSELELPIFGNSDIICVKINDGGIYQCSQYSSRSDSLRHK